MDSFSTLVKLSDGNKKATYQLVAIKMALCNMTYDSAINCRKYQKYNYSLLNKTT